MTTTLRLLLSSLLLLTSHVSANNNADWQAYLKVASNLEAKAPTASFAEITADSIKLTNLSTKILPAFISKHPICKEYLTVALAASSSMQNLSLADIEKDYHADGKLPNMQSASCYHAKDLLVHPATVVVISKTQKDTKETREKIAEELEEVIEHFNQVKVSAGI